MSLRGPLTPFTPLPLPLWITVLVYMDLLVLELS